MFIKDNKEIENIKKCNVNDGITMTKAIYHIKDAIKNKEKLSKYDIKLIVDEYRRKVGKSEYLASSFDTIVAYKENSAIYHYLPSNKNSKVVKSNALLLIDSGGNYLGGTTDITPTISLYKDKIPNIIKNIIHLCFFL